MGIPGRPRTLLRTLVLFCLFTAFLPFEVHAQEVPPKPAEKPAEKKPEDSASSKKAENPAQIELLETRYRFEADGSSRKEVHTGVRINSELGVRQFARLNFDYNRSFESVEIPLVRITHAGGGIADILPSAITDNPNPAVANIPAYQDVRVKSVRIFGLQPGDLLEYRVITGVSHRPLAPDFWLDHTFDRTGVVSLESFELDLPSLPNLRVQISPATPADTSPDSADANSARAIYRWNRKQTSSSEPSKEPALSTPDVLVSTFSSWNQLADRLAAFLIPTEQQSRQLFDQASSVTTKNAGAKRKMADIYDYVSKKIRTVDLPLGVTGFQPHKPADILTCGCGTAEDKFVLFAALANNFFGPARAGFASSTGSASSDGLPNPDRFDHLLTMSGYPSINFWMDLSIEVAPFLMIPTQFQGKTVFVVGPAVENRWETAYSSFPFPSSQKVEVLAKLESDGRLTATVSYLMRGDNELLLRLAFHQAPKEKWKDLAQLLSLSDGFRGKVSTVTVSDPYDTHQPFTLDYEITMPKFVDWSKKPVRIPALLPQIGLPDPPAKLATGASSSAIKLGTPLEVETRMTLHLPPGTTVLAPTGTSVQRDYATFASRYAAKAATITASRHINFLLREVPADRAADYNAFLRAVQNDEAQDFTLEREAPPSPGTKPPTPRPSAVPKP